MLEGMCVLSEPQRRQLDRYAEELARFQSALNLLSRDERDNLGEHISDCTALWDAASLEVGGRLVHDLGSGGGLPGMVCAILAPDVRFVLVDQDRRKAEFLKTTSFRLGLANVGVICQDVLRLQSLEFCVSRGFAPLSRHLEILHAVLAPDGLAFLMKGPGWREELSDCARGMREAFEVGVASEYQLSKGQVRVVLKVVPRGTLDRKL